MSCVLNSFFLRVKLVFLFFVLSLFSFCVLNSLGCLGSSSGLLGGVLPERPGEAEDGAPAKYKVATIKRLTVEESCLDLGGDGPALSGRVGGDGNLEELQLVGEGGWIHPVGE